jgi:exodeoxyribonuclease VII small subunit
MTESPTLEARMARLEAIVRALEGDGLELEQALALFEEGIAHVRASDRLLRESQLRIERLVEDGQGGVVVQAIDVE